MKVHPAGTGARKKTAASHRQVARRLDRPDASGCRGCANGPTFALAPGQAHDAAEGRKLPAGWQRRPDGVPMVMDRADNGDETRHLGLQLGFAPVGPPHPNRRHSWADDRNLHRRRNAGARLVRGLKGFRRIFSRFEPLDRRFTAFIHFALIIDLLCVNTP